MKRRLIKFSNYSFCITLPKKAVEQLGWGKGEEVEVDFDPKTKKIVVSRPGKEPAKDTPKKATPTQSKSADDIQPIPKLRW
jgi:bifunctional DNA-binding transcriptional regulator/antitoxin component of YhaV-PrlF toxin-antitoxin module